MKIAVIMLAKKGGGIEQAAVDYCESLQGIGHDVTAIVFPGSWTELQMKERNIATISLFNLSEYDVLAWFRLRRIIRNLAPDAVITHANRAIGIALRALKKRNFPLVGVVNNYSISRYKNPDMVFAPTADLIEKLVESGILREKIHHIPNMIKCNSLPLREKNRTTLVIGAIGRFVKKKGFDDYIEALAILKNHGIVFKAVLGGSGEEEKALKALAAERKLDNYLEFSGWIEDRLAFYKAIDIFCLPSLHEPFGIVLLEAFTHGAAIISTNSEGPQEIIKADYDGIIVEKKNPQQLADAMEKLLSSSELREKLAANGLAKAKTEYSQEVVARKIEAALIQKF